MEVQSSVVSHLKKLIYDLKAFILCIEVKTYKELWIFLKYQDKCIQTEDMPTDEGAKPKLLQS